MSCRSFAWWIASPPIHVVCATCPLARAKSASWLTPVDMHAATCACLVTTHALYVKVSKSPGLCSLSKLDMCFVDGYFRTSVMFKDLVEGKIEKVSRDIRSGKVEIIMEGLGKNGLNNLTITAYVSHKLRDRTRCPVGRNIVLIEVK